MLKMTKYIYNIKKPLQPTGGPRVLLYYLYSFTVWFAAPQTILGEGPPPPPGRDTNWDGRSWATELGTMTTRPSHHLFKSI